MGNREPTVLSEETALVAPRLRALRDAPVGGISRRTLLRRSLGLGTALWLGEVTAGSLAFLWNSASGGGGRVRVGPIEQGRARGGRPVRRRDDRAGRRAGSGAAVLRRLPGLRAGRPGVRCAGRSEGRPF